MAIPLKRVLFFLFTVTVLLARPALSVPLSSGFDHLDADGEATPAVDGIAEGEGSEARIVDHQVAMTSASERSEEAGPHPEIGIGGQPSVGMGGGHSTPGWVLPAAGIAAGGGALFALMSHDGTGDGGSSASALDQAAGLGASPGGISMGNGGGHGNDNSSDVPEPGTILMVGAGIASFLGRRKILGR